MEHDTDLDAEQEDRITREARTFVLLAIAGGFTAWEVGFDLGAFDVVDHRRYWAVWILCTIALVASQLFRGSRYDLSGRWDFVLAVPTLWLLADLFFLTESDAINQLLAILSVVTLPFALFVLVNLLAGDFFALRPISRLVLVALMAGILGAGWYVGNAHERFLTCYEFERAGDFVPDGCFDDDLGVHRDIDG